MLQLLQDTSLTEQQKEFLSAASISGNALMHIISDILDFSRIESGKMLLVKEPFDFKASVLSSLRLFREEAEAPGLDLYLEIDPDIPELLLGDNTRVQQIFFNLVGNALKFTSEGGIVVSCSLESAASEESVVIRITVADTGIGIPRDRQGELFKAFAGVDSFLSKRTAGTGLGLSIVKRLTAMMDGEVSLESEPGEGASVTCTITLGLVAPRAAETDAHEDAASGSPLRPLDILVAEDDAVSRFAIRTFLNRGGHRSVCVHNGRQALEALQLYPFDCLLTDIQMPDMDGLELARRIHNNQVGDIPPSREVIALVRGAFPAASQTPCPIDPRMEIVAVSAHAMAGDRERFLEEGINHYVAKPIILRQLNEVLSNIPRRQRTWGPEEEHQPK
jgi:CheY-like chemotaxis protein/anti-sigma regulatory factor (Ser/Thr protein kinase)